MARPSFNQLQQHARRCLEEEKYELVIPSLLPFLASFSQASTNDENREIRLMCSKAFNALHSWDESLVVIEPLLPPSLDDHELVLLLIEALAGSGNAQAAWSWLDPFLNETCDPLDLLPVLVRWAFSERRFDLAGRYLDEIETLSPHHCSLFLLRAELLRLQGDNERSLALLRSALVFHASRRIVHLHLAAAYRDSLQIDKAISVLKNAAQCFGLDGSLRDGIVDMAYEQPHLDEAIQLLEKTNQHLKDDQYWAQLGALYFRSGDLERSQIALREATKPGHQLRPDASARLAQVLRLQGKLDDATAFLEAQFREHPDSPAMAFELAQDHLLHQRWRCAWPLYEQRLLTGETIFPLGLTPSWSGESLTGKKVLVLAEQGLGDMIMACKMLRSLDLDASSWLVLGPPALEKLVQSTFGGYSYVSEISQATIDSFEITIGLSSLFTYYKYVPQANSGLPLFSLRSDDISAWRLALQALPGSRSIGFSWFGGGNPEYRSLRSLALEQMLPLFSISGINWISLQYGGQKVEDELLEFKNRHSLNIISYGGTAIDLYQQACCCSALDLTISVQQTLVHVAGAVGANLWAMIPTIPEWRYGLDSCKIPWYSSVELLRQKDSGEWSELILRIKQRLV